MRFALALLAIVIGALETAGGAQELIYLGFLRSETYPLIAGTLGTVAGALLLAAGIAMLVRSRMTAELVHATVFVSVPVFILIGVVTQRAGWPMTALGIGFPLVLLLFCRRRVAA